MHYDYIMPIGWMETTLEQNVRTQIETHDNVDQNPCKTETNGHDLFHIDSQAEDTQENPHLQPQQRSHLPDHEPGDAIETTEVKEEDQVKRGHKQKNSKEKPIPKPKRKIFKQKKKQKRQRKKIQDDDPRNRGIPKVKKISKRKNKPKVVSEEVKREAQIKREEEDYHKKIAKRGKKPFIKKLRGEKKRMELKKRSQILESVKLEDGTIALKIEESEEGTFSESSKFNSNMQAKGYKRRISRRQRQREQDEDKQKVDNLMIAHGERERREEIQNMVRLQRIMAAKFGNRLSIEIDPSCKYYSQYKFKCGEIQKCGKLYCQIYNKYPVPKEEKHYFQLKITRLTFQSVTIGLITSNNFGQQYSRDKPGCICFDAYTHSTYVEGAKTQLQVEVKLNDIIRTIIDIPKANVYWYLNNDFISEAIIPHHMAAVPLYPYLQVSNKWIKLKINDFQQ